MIETSYLGMSVALDDVEVDNHDYFAHCASHNYHLQRCECCKLLRYPPTSGCPFCGDPICHWTPVEARGVVHSFVEVHHAIQPAFKPHVPYLALLVELDIQQGVPGPEDGLRIMGNLVDTDGVLAGRELVESVGIGSRVRMVFTDLAPGFSLPQWTLDASASQPALPWRPAL